MNKLDLFEAMNYIDEDLIKEADMQQNELSADRLRNERHEITVSGVEVRSGIKWHRIAALASAVLLVAGLGTIIALMHDNMPARHIKPTDNMVPAVTESTTNTKDKTENTERETAEDTSAAPTEETKEGTNTVTTSKADNKPERIDCYAEDKAKNTTSEPNELKPVSTEKLQTTRSTTKTSAKTTQKTTQPTTTTTKAVRSEKDEIFDRLDKLDYIPITCDGLPEFKLTTDSGQVYWLHFNDRYVWKDGIDAEAKLPQDIIEWLIANQDKVNLQKIEWNHEPTTDDWEIHLPCTKTSEIAWRPYECPEMFEILRSIDFRPITAAEFAVSDYEAPNTYLIDKDVNNRIYALNFDHKWVMRYGTDGTDCGDAPMPDRLYELFCGS